MNPPTKVIKGLYAVTPDLADTAVLLAKAQAVLAGGARLIQYRNKTADDRLRHEQALALKRLCVNFGAALIVNDDVVLADEIAADGVHVGADDATVAFAREKLGGTRIIGVSCYDDLTRAYSAADQGADYVAFGSFFASAVKPRAVPAPLALLHQARQWGRLPVVAIGGITLANADALIQAGADAIAVISALFAAADIETAARGFCHLFEVKTS